MINSTIALPGKLTRRSFLMGCSAAIAEMAGARLTNMAFASPLARQTDTSDVLVSIFLRGGWDALSVVLPVAGVDRGYYEAERIDTRVPVTGTNKALDLKNADFSSARLGLHPAMSGLRDLYYADKLAIIHATGLKTSDTRSHFDAMQFMELGTPGNKGTSTGWIARHLLNLPGYGSGLINSMATGGSQPMSLAGTTDTATLTGAGGFNIADSWRWYQPWQMSALRAIYTDNDWLGKAGQNTLQTIDSIESTSPTSYTPANGAVYPGSPFGNSLKLIAQMIKLEVGLKAVTVDYGGWDTHENQGTIGNSNYMYNQLSDVSAGLSAFYKDMDSPSGTNYANKLTVVVQSEFGRRVKENASGGTDHGHGQAMFVLGGGINGGKVYGQWPGLANEQLFDRADLAITTDYRTILSELVVRRLRNPNISRVFPNFAYQPLGIAQGSDTVSGTTGGGKVFMPAISR